ncbi:MAG: PQQ-binding-like beta-propeller repeat protein [Caldilineaceae bacterium]
MRPAPRPPETPSPLPLLIGATIVLLFLLLAAGGLLFAAQTGLLAGATPTPTSTPGATVGPTADFRATRTAEDAATQVAYAGALATLTAETLAGATPNSVGGDKFLPVITNPGLTATAIAPAPAEVDAAATATVPDAGVIASPEGAPGLLPVSPLETPTQVIVSLPVVDTGGVPTVAVAAATPTPTNPPVTLIPTLPAEPTATSTTTPSPTPTFTLAPPTATATPFATPTPTVAFALNSMRGVIDRQNAISRVGPGSFYTQSATINIGTQVTLLARDTTGEWVYLCCTPGNNGPAWVRGVSARPVENPTLPPPLNELNQNDIRWLVVRGPDANQTPVPSLAPVAITDFPMFRHDRGNTARVAQLPRLPLATAWSGQSGLAGQSYTSGAVLAGNAVFAASGDGHLYAFNRDAGGQLWRFNLGEVARATPLVDGSQVYVVTESGRLFALENQGQAAAQRWMTALGGVPRSGILPAPNRLVLTMRQPDGERLVILDRGNGAVLRNVALGNAQSQAPALSAQTVYVASDLVRAYDLWSGELVWQSTEGTQYTTPPLLMVPGVEAAAELYVADTQGRLLAYDANTGQLIWAAPVGGTATGIAASGTTVFVSGPGFVRAFARVRRTEGQLLWTAGIAGNVPGGPIVDETRVLVVSDGGGVQYLDAITGALIAANVQAQPLGGAAAAVSPWLFAPGQNAVLFAAREGP